VKTICCNYTVFKIENHSCHSNKIPNVCISLHIAPSPSIFNVIVCISRVSDKGITFTGKELRLQRGIRVRLQPVVEVFTLLSCLSLFPYVAMPYRFKHCSARRAHAHAEALMGLLPLVRERKRVERYRILIKVSREGWGGGGMRRRRRRRRR
jgi:hypothetical protein